MIKELHLEDLMVGTTRLDYEQAMKEEPRRATTLMILWLMPLAPIYGFRPAPRATG